MTVTFDNIIIRASAGSGKTFQLSNRYIQLLLAGVSPDRILASTFTKKAAGEISDRILRRLAQGALHEEGCKKLAGELGLESLTREQIQNCLEKLILHLNQMRVSTLDSLFNKLTKSFAIELNLPPNWTIVEKTEDDRLLLSAIRMVLSSMSVHNAVQLISMLFEDKTNKSVATHIFNETKDFFDMFNDIDENAGPISLYRKSMSDEEVDELIIRLNSAPLPITGKGVENTLFRNAVNSISKCLGDKNWEPFLKKPGLMTSARFEGEKYQRIYVHDYPELKDVLLELFKYACTCILNDLSNKTELTWNATKKIAEYHRELKYEQGDYQYSDVTTVLSHFNWDERRQQMISRLGSEPDHIMLDEFQDTATNQWQILRPLAELVTRGNGKSLFCVGDTKQAIYGWRGGNVQLFDIVAKMDNMKEVRLPANRRSSQIIIDVVNQVFSNLAKNCVYKGPITKTDTEFNKDLLTVSHKAAEEWSNAFDVHTTAGKSGELPGYFALEEAPLVDKNNPENLKKILDRIAELLQMEENVNPDFIFNLNDNDESGDDSNTGEEDDDSKTLKLGYNTASARAAWTVFRTLQEHQRHPNCEIGILTRGNSFAATLTGLFKRFGIDVSGEGGVPLAGSPAVEDILAILRIADHPGDTIAWYQLAQREPFAKKLHIDPNATKDSTSSAFYIDPVHARAVSHRIRDHIATRSLGIVVGEFIQIIEKYCTPEEQERLTKLREYASSWTGDTNRLSPFIENVRNHKVTLANDSKIRIMTLHSAKGLEFDIVFLPELDKNKTKVTADFAVKKVIQRNEKTQRIQQFLLGIKKQDYWPALPDNCKKLYHNIWIEQYKESLCLLYVGMTRAVQELIVITEPFEPFTPKESIESRTVPFSLAGILRGALVTNNTPTRENMNASENTDDNTQTAETEVASIILYQHGNPNWTAKTDQAAAPKEQAATPSQTSRRPPQKPVAESPIVFLTPPSFHNTHRWTRQNVYTRGLVLHRCFEETKWLDRDGMPNRDYLREQIFQMIFDKKLTEEYLDEFEKICQQEMVQRTLSLKSYTDAEQVPFSPLTSLTGVTCELFRERAYSELNPNGYVQRGIMDRLVLLRENDRVTGADIIDYKTDQLTLTPEGQIDLTANRERLQQYTSQIKNYYDLIQRWYQLPSRSVSRRLFFVSHQEIFDVGRPGTFPWAVSETTQEV